MNHNSFSIIYLPQLKIKALTKNKRLPIKPRNINTDFIF